MLEAVAFVHSKLEKRPQLNVRKASTERFYEKPTRYAVNTDDRLSIGDQIIVLSFHLTGFFRTPYFCDCPRNIPLL